MKTLKFYLFAVGCLMLSSCITVNYLGDKRTPATTNVDVFYSAHDVKNQYKVLGHMTCPNSNTAMIKKELVAYAQKIGADAVIINEPQVTKSADVVNADAIAYEK